MSGSNSYWASIASMGFLFKSGGIIWAFSLLQHRRSLHVFPIPGDQWPPCHKKALAFQLFGSSHCGTTLFCSEFVLTAAAHKGPETAFVAPVLRLLSTVLRAGFVFSPFGIVSAGHGLDCFKSMGGIRTGLALGLVGAFCFGWLFGGLDVPN